MKVCCMTNSFLPSIWLPDCWRLSDKLSVFFDWPLVSEIKVLWFGRNRCVHTIVNCRRVICSLKPKISGLDGDGASASLTSWRRRLGSSSWSVWCGGGLPIFSSVPARELRWAFGSWPETVAIYGFPTEARSPQMLSYPPQLVGMFMRARGWAALPADGTTSFDPGREGRGALSGGCDRITGWPWEGRSVAFFRRRIASLSQLRWWHDLRPSWASRSYGSFGAR